LPYTIDSHWRNRAESCKDAKHRSISRANAARTRLPIDQTIWGCRENRIAVRFAYEWRDDGAHWFRSYGNEMWNSMRTD